MRVWLDNNLGSRRLVKRTVPLLNNNTLSLTIHLNKKNNPNITLR